MTLYFFHFFFVVLERILFLLMYLPHTWAGEANLEEYFQTLKGVDRDMQDIKQKYKISGIIAGMDVQVEVKPRQGPFVGDGKECLVEKPQSTAKWKANSRACSWSASQSMRSSCRTLLAKDGNLQERRKTRLTSGIRMRCSCRNGRSLTTMLLPIKWETRSTVVRKLQCSEPYRSSASTDLCKAAGKEREVAARRQFSNKRVETNEQKVMKLDLEE